MTPGHVRNLAMVLKSGGGVYNLDWVRALVNGVRETTSVIPRVTLLTDVPGARDLSGVRTLELTEGWPGWWSKLELFRPGLFSDSVLYVDLDSLPVGDLKPLLELPGPGFYSLRDFYRPELAASGVMAWTPGADTAGLFWKAKNEIRAKWPPKGRMDLFLRGLGFRPSAYLQDEFPGALVSLKPKPRQVLGKAPPEALLVCAHGRPRFTEVRTGWAHRLWKERVG